MTACTIYSNRMVVNTSCRIRSRSRTLPSTQCSTFSKPKSKLRCHQSFRSIATRSHVPSTFNMYKNSQRSFTTLVSNTQDQERINFHVLLSSTVLAFGIFSASTTTTQRHHDPLSSVGSGSNSNYYKKQAGNGRRGSGGEKNIVKY